MNKQETFQKIIQYEVRKSLVEAYRLPSLTTTANQDRLIDLISSRLYKLFGDSVTVKDLQEKVDAVSKSL